MSTSDCRLLKQRGGPRCARLAPRALALAPIWAAFRRYMRKTLPTCAYLSPPRADPGNGTYPARDGALGDGGGSGGGRGQSGEDGREFAFVDDGQAVRRAGDPHVEVVTALGRLRDDAGRIGQDDPVELQALGLRDGQQGNR